jgi:hypothetical protein
MRALIMIAAIFALAACSNNDQADNTQNIDENLTAENIVSNDVTAIDAVTGDAANMAAEAEVNDLGNVSNDEGNTAAFPRPKPQTTSSTAPKPSTSTDESNTTGNSD